MKKNKVLVFLISVGSCLYFLRKSTTDHSSNFVSFFVNIPNTINILWVILIWIITLILIMLLILFITGRNKKDDIV